VLFKQVHFGTKIWGTKLSASTEGIFYEYRERSLLHVLIILQTEKCVFFKIFVS